VASQKYLSFIFLKVIILFIFLAGLLFLLFTVDKGSDSLLQIYFAIKLLFIHDFAKHEDSEKSIYHTIEQEMFVFCFRISQ
jgi:hypothetical protein